MPQWEVTAFHMQSVGQRRCHSGGNRGRPVTAIVGEYQHGVRTTCLASQREETSPDAFGLILCRNRNHDEIFGASHYAITDILESTACRKIFGRGQSRSR